VRRSPFVVAFVVLVTVSSVAGVAVAQEGDRSSGYGGQPNLNVLAPSPTVSPGEQTTLTLQVTNRGEVTSGIPPAREAVTTARNVRVEVNGSDTPLVVRSGKQSVGSVTESRPGTAPVELEVPDGVEPGTYELEVDLTYSYTDRVIPSLFRTSERTRTVSRTVDVVVESGPRFDVRTLETDAQVGGSGTATVEVENVGTEAATDVSVALESRSPQVTFEDSPTAFATVGRLAPGERRSVRVGVDFGSEASVRSYPLAATISYDDVDGFAGTDDDPSLQVRPLSEQTVRVENVSSTLRVGEEGTLRATVVNEGPADLDNAVVTLQPPAENVEVVEPEVAIGDLAGGESTNVSFDVELASAAREGVRQFGLETEYEGADGDLRSVDPVRFQAAVGPQRDVFAVETRNATVTAGGTNRIVLAVTNQRNETVTDVSAKLFASSPLSADDDEAYVASLLPGETTEIPFRVSASGSALAKEYPISVDFQYVDRDGETRLSDTYRRPVTVVAGGGGLFGSVVPVGLLAAVSLLAVPLAPLALRRM
jgi:hypothetical protein